MTEQIDHNGALSACRVTTESTVRMSDGKRGFIFALSAYLLWGIPHLKTVAHMPALEVVAHRVIWSVPIAGALLWWLGLFGDLKVALTTPRMLGMAMLTASGHYAQLGHRCRPSAAAMPSIRHLAITSILW